jgi:DNA-binding transcriptional regulator YhcF (GntR family)
MFEMNTVALPPEIMCWGPFSILTIFAERVDNEKSRFGVPLVSRRLQLFVPPIVLDRASQVPLHRQIHDQIAQAIRASAVDYEARLPSTRTMATLLGVSRNTVLSAYENLVADDLARGERGSGMRINTRRKKTLHGLRQVIRAAGYPVRVLALADPDGNPLTINF